jgi:putative transposase
MLSIREQCELLQLNRSVYYYDRKPIVSEEDIIVMDAIDKLYTKRPYFGVRRITKHLEIPDILVNHKRVHRLMQVMGIQAIYPRPNTSIGNKQHEIYPYLLTGVKAAYPNHIWGTDITYIRVKGTWMYLVAMLDWFSRYVISWELSDKLCVAFCTEALQKALAVGIPDIHNSDQGAQFTAEEYLALLKLYETIQISMDGRGRAMDNIFTERLWRTVKYEEVYLKEYQSPKEARQSLTEYFTFYNHERKHQAHKYRTPAEIYFNRR